MGAALSIGHGCRAAQLPCLVHGSSGPRIGRAPPRAPVGLDHQLTVDLLLPNSPSLTAACCIPSDARSFLRFQPSSSDEILS
jgi:hypothetical protein